MRFGQSRSIGWCPATIEWRLSVQFTSRDRPSRPIRPESMIGSWLRRPFHRRWTSPSRLRPPGWILADRLHRDMRTDRSLPPTNGWLVPARPATPGNPLAMRGCGREPSVPRGVLPNWQATFPSIAAIMAAETMGLKSLPGANSCRISLYGSPRDPGMPLAIPPLEAVSSRPRTGPGDGPLHRMHGDFSFNVARGH